MSLRTATWTAAFFLATAAASFLIARLSPPPAIIAFDQAGILLGFLLSCLAAAGLLVGLLHRPDLHRLLRRWLDRRAFENAGVRLARFEQRVDAMVIPVSRREQPAWILRHLRPQRVALLCTEATHRHAVALADTFGDRVVFDPSREELERGMWLDDPHDPDESRRLALYYIDRLRAAGIARRRIFVDTTGGTVPMSIGAFQAAEQAGVSSIYVIGQATDGERTGLILDPEDPADGEPQYMSDHTRRGRD